MLVACTPALLAASIVATASVEPSRAFTIEPASAEVSLAADEQIGLTIRAPLGSVGLPVLDTNLGRISGIKQRAAGTYDATYHAPESGRPAVAIIVGAISNSEGRLYAVARIRLVAEAVVELETTPGADVELWAFDQHFGPTRTDAAGRVAFRVTANRPSFAYRYRINAPGVEPVEREERVISFESRAPWWLGLLPAAGAHRPGEPLIIAAVATDDGRPTPPALDCELEAGADFVVTAEGSGLRILRVDLPPRVGRELTMRCTAGDVAVIRRTLVLAPPAPPARLTLSAPAVHRADEGALVIRVGGLTEEGRATAVPADLMLSVVLAGADGDRSLDGFSPAAELDGTVHARVVVPVDFAGSDRLKITARLPNAPLEGTATVRLRPAAPAELRVTRDKGPVVASGRSRVALRAELVDRFGNAEPAPVQATAKLGRIEVVGTGTLRYAAPLLTASAEDVLAMSSGELTCEHAIELEAPTLLEVDAGLGVYVTHRGAVAPAALIGAAMGHGRLMGRLSVGFAESFSDAPETFGDTTITRDWRALAVTASGDYRLDLTDHLALRLGAGLGVSLFGTELGAAEGGEVVRPHTQVWAAALHLAGLTRLVFDLGSWGATLSVDVQFSPTMGDVPDTLAVTSGVGLYYLWGW